MRPIDWLITLAVLVISLGVVWYIYGVNKRRIVKVMADIKARDNLLNTVNTVAMSLLEANDSRDIETSINEGMKQIGGAINVDRINIWRAVIRDNEPEYHRDYSWVSDASGSKKALPYTLKNLDSLGWTDVFFRNERIIGTLTSMPENDKRFLNAYQILSIVIIPLFIDNIFWGLFTVDTCIYEKNFTEDEVNILQSVSLMMAVKINHNFMRTRMREANERTSFMFDSNPQVNILFNCDFNVIDCNPATLEFFGLKSKTQFILGFADIISKSAPEFQRDGSRTISLKEWLTVAVDKGFAKFETELFVNGDERILSVEFIKIPYESSHAIVGYVDDVTEAKHISLELERRRKDAEIANTTKSTFLANMSHEIRTPMNSIIGFSELALGDDIPEKTTEFLNNILSSAKWLLQIINDLLDISKIESGKMELENIPFDLPDVIEHCKSLLLPKSKGKGIDLKCFAEPTPGRMLLGDPVRLRQVITNILTNAVKFTKEGFVELSAVNKSIDEDKVKVHFEIKDSGIGMTPEQVERVYEPFTQADNSITRRFGGTGLGLAITKDIIELMGGTLEAESEVGVGSTFSFELTFCSIDDDSVVADDKLATIELQKPHFDAEILVCEDNAMNQAVISEHLTRVGVRVVIANNGKEGVDIVKERVAGSISPEESNSVNKPFDLIFMDVHMPVMDGLEAAMKITEMGVETPIIAVTANIMAHDMEYYKSCGMKETLGKPFTAKDLWKCLLRYIQPAGKPAANIAHHHEDDDDAFLQKMKLEFAKYNRNKFSEILDSLHSGDITSAYRLVHSLKSNAAHINYEGLRNAAADVESMLKGGENHVSKRQLDVLEAEIKSVLDELAPLLLEYEAMISVKITDKDRIREIFDDLKPFLISKNPECEDMLDDLYRIEGAEKLAAKVENFRFDQALEELDILRSEIL